MLFVTIGVAYHERAQSPGHWQHIHVPSAAVAEHRLDPGEHLDARNRALCVRSARTACATRIGWRVTVAIGAAFLASQLFALRELARQGIYLRNNPHSSLFYVLTGAHGIHLLGGMVALVCLLVTASRRPEVVLFDFRRQSSRTAAAALYWHFLAAIWLCLFVGLLFWP